LLSPRILRASRTIAIVCSKASAAGDASLLKFGGGDMVQTTNRFFDEVARLMNDAAGVAQGVRREFETLFRSQAERILRDLAVVQREEFEAVKDMARLAREENEALKARIVALEGKLAAGGPSGDPAGASAPGETPRGT
jgi:BMFP domain-containing protein YqiC